MQQVCFPLKKSHSRAELKLTLVFPSHTHTHTHTRNNLRVYSNLGGLPSFLWRSIIRQFISMTSAASSGGAVCDFLQIVLICLLQCVGSRGGIKPLTRSPRLNSSYCPSIGAGGVDRLRRLGFAAGLKGGGAQTTAGRIRLRLDDKHAELSGLEAAQMEIFISAKCRLK